MVGKFSPQTQKLLDLLRGHYPDDYAEIETMGIVAGGRFLAHRFGVEYVESEHFEVVIKRIFDAAKTDDLLATIERDR